METVTRVASWVGLWFAVGVAFLLLWAGLTWVGRQLTAWAHREIDEARHRESDLDAIWCPFCSMSHGNHTPNCEYEFFLRRTTRAQRQRP